MTWSTTKAEPSHRARKPRARRSPSGWTTMVVVFASFASSPSLATSLTYIESFPAATAPETLIHLIDQDETTQWCSDTSSGSTRIRFHFKRAQAIKHARIQLARRPTFALPLKLNTATQVLAIKMAQRQLRVDLVQSLKGSFVDIIIPSHQEPQCITELELASTTHLLTQLSHDVDVVKNRIALAGTWKRGALGSPTTYWTFSLDGSWTWKEHSPLLARSKQLRGTWTLSQNLLTLKMPNQRKPVRLSLARREVIIDDWAEDAPDKDYQELTIGSSSRSILSGSYNNASFEMLH
ncbi:MAG: hypothetical protein VX834_02690 [Myxococcota bacterium]|nr:hypothetical protein [Myxococcota bacterium]